jgi:tetratricopeptide (TPR) repeat protein
MLSIKRLRTAITNRAIVALLIALQGCAALVEKESDSAVDRMAATQQSQPDQVNGVVVEPEVIPTDPYLSGSSSANREQRALFKRALDAMEEQRWEEASLDLQSLLALNPLLSGAQLNLGIVYQHQKQFELAEESFEAAVAANDKNYRAYNQWAMLKRQQGEFREAERLYLQALAVWPYYADGHRNIAILYDLYLSKPALALEHFQRCQQLQKMEPGEGIEDRQLQGWIIELQRRLPAVTVSSGEDA